MRKKILGSAMVTALIVSFVSAILFTSVSMQPVVEKQTIKARDHWNENRPLGDADPGSGNTGFMYVMVYPHQADPGTAYASNLSNASAYEYSDSTNCELTGETPHSVAVDYVMKVRVNNSDGYNSSGSTWEDSWVRANITIDFDYLTDETDTAMTEQVIGTEYTTYRWYHYYLNNAGNGYTLSKGELFNITALTFDIWE